MNINNNLSLCYTEYIIEDTWTNTLQVYFFVNFFILN